jgi:conjugative transposon TraM protein
MEQERSQKFIRQRKFFMALPILALPFITLLFWALGGGKVSNVDAQEQTAKGFNIELPGANLKDEKGLGKMDYYNQAQTDSAKKKDEMKNDPYYTAGATGSEYDEHTIPVTDNGYGSVAVPAPYTLSSYQDPNEAKVYSRLKQLDNALNAPVALAPKEKKVNNTPAVNSGDIDRLETMMRFMQQGNGSDPEMQQMDAMMERILDVQHPERVQEKLRQSSEQRKGQVFAVLSAKQPDPLSSLAKKEEGLNLFQQTKAIQNGFYGLEQNELAAGSQNAIEAVIHENQTVVSGATIKLRLLNDILINGILIPKDNFVFGVANLSGERLRIQIGGVRYLNQLFPVAMNVYDLDGLDGINVPGAITRDVAKQSADRSMQNIGVTSIDASWQVQAAGAGVEAAKSLFSKKVKLVKVTLKAGYKVLLYDEKQKQVDK